VLPAVMSGNPGAGNYGSRPRGPTQRRHAADLLAVNYPAAANNFHSFEAERERISVPLRSRKGQSDVT
jgi:hypothetical protein